ncbi:MAG: PemK family transcriptional regulator [Mycoplasmataceae bacterium RC_NB112A]|nr:MAG: PemK family transcriptional regulator [Mycoplasmataceae bacterium RC_NB112A]
MTEKLIKRGDIYWVDFTDNKGHELKEIRPYLVISNDKQNIFSSLIIVSPITSLKEGDKIFPFQVSIKLKKESIMLVDQIQTIDRGKFLDKIARISEETMEKVEKCIHLVLSLKN